MEQLVLGIFQEQLSKFIVGFRKEQVTANLLNGKGEISNVELNCSFLNEIISKISPYIELESVTVSKLSFHVTSWTNLRKAPIVVTVGHVKAVVVEPLHYSGKGRRRRIRQVTPDELAELIRLGVAKEFRNRGSYGLLDRILDNVSVEVVSVQIFVQPWGAFKTRRIGPWTPPQLQVRLAGIQVSSVNEYGQEAPPDEVWRHNHDMNKTGSLFIYKKVQMEYQVLIQPHTLNGDSGEKVDPVPLVSGLNNKMEVHIAMQRRVKDGEWLAVQVDTTIPHVEVNIEADTVPLLAHTASGFMYLFAKDRAFQDPLRYQTIPIETNSSLVPSQRAESIKAVPTTSSSLSTEVNVTDTSKESVLEGSVNGDDDKKNKDAAHESTASATVDDARQSLTAPIGHPADSVQYQSKNNNAAQKQQGSHATNGARAASRKGRPILLLPMGAVIHEKFSISVSVHRTCITGIYAYDKRPSSVCGYSELLCKGFIGEVIWPKVNGEKGFYAQASISYVSLQERRGQQVQTLLSGGVPRHDYDPVESPRKSLPEVNRDENFPFFEERSVRSDPLGLRQNFPSQAVGLKSTVDFVKKLSKNRAAEDTEKNIKVLHEIGINRFDIVMEPESWCRALKFTLNVDGGGFDPRWHSGGWDALLTPDMLISDSIGTLRLDDCVQTPKRMFLDENQLISSDLFNVTARICEVNLRVPAAVRNDPRSCDIVIKMDQIMVVVSSVLPRTFSSGKLGNSAFPNDPTDVAFILENTEDPSIRQKGIMTTRSVSTFRLQFTSQGISINLVPVISLCKDERPQQLLVPTNLTMIICFEGEPPQLPESKAKMVLFTSVLFHQLEINLDFDLLANALTTLLHHTSTIKYTVDECRNVVTPPENNVFEHTTREKRNHASMDQSSRIPDSLRGREVLVKRQMIQSRSTGGLSVSCCIHVTDFGLTLWRQHVPYTNPLRSSSPAYTDIDETNQSYLPLLNLLEFTGKSIELGIEGILQQQCRRIVAKVCMSKMGLKVCDFISLLQNSNMWVSMNKSEKTEPNSKLSPPEITAGTSREQENIEAASSAVVGLREIFSLGGSSKEGSSSMDASKGMRSDDYAVAIRAEEKFESSSRSCSLLMNVQSNAVANLRVEEFEMFVLLILEAFLMPAGSDTKFQDSRSSLFPRGTVGRLLLSLIPSKIASPSSKFDLDEGSDSQVDRLLRDIITKAFPADLKFLLFRCHIRDMLIHVPGTEGNNRKEFGLFLHNADLAASYLATTGVMEQHVRSMLDILGRNSQIWSLDVDQFSKPGIRHQIQTRQSIRSFVHGGSNEEKDNIIVPPFDFGCNYADSKAGVFMREGLTVDNVEKLDELISRLSSFSERCKQILANTARAISTLKYNSNSGIYGDKNRVSSEEEARSPSTIACSQTSASIRSVRQLFHLLNQKRSIKDQQMDTIIQQKDNELDRLRRIVFEKEKDRIGAIALVSSQATGWLRIGGAQITGQRGLLTCMLLPQWSILRRSLLILYTAPGQYKPNAIVSLSGASLRQLAGGQRKRDLNRAFGIVESSGVKHLVVARTDAEYFNWVRELQAAIDRSSPQTAMANEEDAINRNEGDGMSSNRDFSQSERTDSFNSLAGTSSSVPAARPLGRSLSRAVQAAKATGQAVAERRRRKNTEDSNTLKEQIELTPPDLAIGADNDPITSQSEISDSFNSLAGSSSSAPAARPLGRSLSRAVQAAKATGQAVAERRRRKNTEDSDTPKEQIEFTSPDMTIGAENNHISSQPMKSIPDDLSLSPGGRCSRRQQLRDKISGARQATKSRLGSALQVARQKGLEVAEKRRDGSSKGNDGVGSEVRVDGLDRSVSEPAEGQLGMSGKQNTRSRFAGVGQATKLRFGSALEAARQKGQEVAEKRRNRVNQLADEVCVDQLPPTSSEDAGGALTEELIFSNTEQIKKATLDVIPDDQQCDEAGSSVSLPDLVLDNELEHGPDLAEDEIDEKLNNAAGPNPDECHKPSSFSQDVEFSDDEDKSVLSQLSNDGEAEGSGRRLGMRQRLGSAVRSVRSRKGGQDDQSSVSDSNRNLLSMRRIGSFGQQQANNVSTHGAPDSIRLKNVSFSGPLMPPEHPFFGEVISGESFPIPCKKLDGNWFVKVEIAPLDFEAMKTNNKIEKPDAQSKNVSGAEQEGDTVDDDFSKEPQPNGSDNPPPELAKLKAEVKNPCSTDIERPMKEAVVQEVLKLDNSSKILTNLNEINEEIEQPHAQKTNNHSIKNEADCSQSGSSGHTANSGLADANVPHSQLCPDCDQTESRSSQAKKFELAFRIFVFEHGKMQNKPVADFVRSLPEILAFHTALSECISNLPFCVIYPEETGKRTLSGTMTQDLASVLGVTSLDMVRITGKLLGGLLEPPASRLEEEAVRKYYAEVITESLNSMLDCPLPLDGLSSLTEFLCLSDVSTQASTLDSNTSDVESTPKPNSSFSSSVACDLYSLSTSCEAELLRAEKQSFLAENLASIVSIAKTSDLEKSSSLPTINGPLVPESVSNKFQEAMHSALMIAMEERDEARAKMVASSVLHSNEIQQHRKSYKRLEAQLSAAKSVATASMANSAALSFGDKDCEANVQKEKLRRFEMSMQQDSDMELISLCNQLTNAISAQTSADLEIERLKECRKIEKENEDSEKLALKEKLKLMTELLAEERSKNQTVMHECKRWKESYEKLIQLQHESEKIG